MLSTRDSECYLTRRLCSTSATIGTGLAASTHAALCMTHCTMQPSKPAHHTKCTVVGQRKGIESGDTACGVIQQHLWTSGTLPRRQVPRATSASQPTTRGRWAACLLHLTPRHQHTCRCLQPTHAQRYTHTTHAAATQPHAVTRYAGCRSKGPPTLQHISDAQTWWRVGGGGATARSP
jgi:hypothetical protein